MKIKLNKTPAYYINLDSSQDRNKHMGRLLDLIFDKYYRVSAYDRNQVSLSEQHSYASGYEFAYKHSVAVAESHLRALRSINQTPSIILEDDVVLIKPKNTIRIPDNADIVYLGFVPVHVYEESEEDYIKNFANWQVGDAKIDKKDSSPDCYRVYGMVCCHAMLYLTDRSVQRTIEIFEESRNTGIPIDVLSEKMMKELNVYVTKNTIFGQEGQPDTLGHARNFKPGSFIPTMTVLKG